MMMLFATLVAAIVKLNGFLIFYLENKEDENRLAELDADDHDLCEVGSQLLGSFSFNIIIIIYYF